MSLDGKILARARTKLEKKRADNEELAHRRRAEAYLKNPHIEEIDCLLRSTAAEAIGLALSKGSDPVRALSEISERNLLLQEERGQELLRVGLPMDYLNEKYDCRKCRDTGYNGTELCSCLMEIYREEQRKELSELIKLGRETFDTFDLSLYSDEPDPASGVSPRSVMEVIYETCVQYACKFSERSINLFLTGPTGVGKTFLSTCIAKVVSERGYSVVYDTAGSVFTKYENEKFARAADMDALRAELRRLETCDLLIIDDLGTEFSTAFVTSALYALVNTRLMTGRKMIINTNLDMKDLSSRYSAAVFSRLTGEFDVLKFAGSDIRRIK